MNWRTVAKRRVWALGVVGDMPVFDDGLRFTKAVEDIAFEAFIPELVNAGLAIAGLPRCLDEVEAPDNKGVSRFQPGAGPALSQSRSRPGCFSCTFTARTFDSALHDAVRPCVGANGVQGRAAETDPGQPPSRCHRARQWPGGSHNRHILRTG